MALQQKKRPKSRKATESDADRQIREVCAVLHRYRRAPAGQAALVVALLRAMGGTSGVMPNLVDIATELGVCHQRAYRTLIALEGKGVIRRNLVEIVL